MIAALAVPRMKAAGQQSLEIRGVIRRAIRIRARDGVRCMHLDRSGWQCPMEAVEGTEFCADHTRFLDPDNEPYKGTPLLYRLTALALLLVFLYNYYQIVLGWLAE